ncbi:MAG: HAMP domain-containing histidine kinase [Magnetococcales bacterium]|nr:HAMP domain-containing histidine kinase [Magnetococcales bacterium]MBF0117038.1 HAMP domain-containing histidine kinase [Magnetococcales bacterium]
MAVELNKHRLAENRLLQSEKISSLGRLAMGLAHEINNPLANALMHLELLRHSEGVADSGTLTRLKTIESNVTRAMAIAKDLLNFSRAESAAFTELNIHDALDCVLSLLEHRMRSIRVQTFYCLEMPQVSGIGSKLEQVFMNLIQNAIDAMPQGGDLLLMTEALDHGIMVTVRDSGPGIPPALRPKVLETFFTTRHASGGIGLGLTVVQSILAQHRGTLILTDAPEGGLDAIVTLPYRPTSAAQDGANGTENTTVLPPATA